MTLQLVSRAPHLVAAMDEIPIFLNMERFRQQDSSALRLWGSSSDQWLFTAVLSALSDGSLLPPLLLFRGAPCSLPEGFPNNVLLEARPEGFTDLDCQDVWISKVCVPAVPSGSPAQAELRPLSSRAGLATPHVCPRLLLTPADGGRPPRTPEGSVQEASGLSGHQRGLHPLRLQQLRAAAGRVRDAGAAGLPAGKPSRLLPLPPPLTCVPLQARWNQLVSQGGLDGLTLDQLALTLACWLSELSSILNSKTHFLRRQAAFGLVTPCGSRLVEPACCLSQVLLLCV